LFFCGRAMPVKTAVFSTKKQEKDVKTPFSLRKKIRSEKKKLFSKSNRKFIRTILTAINVSDI
ncbi:MAG: hypothetical protein J6C62_06925, partial [Clostridia bacterium]|nr:hypothetical protein [Clostridia bacterium]